MQSREYYVTQAQQTLTNVRQQLIFGSNAKIDEGKSDYKRLDVIRAMVTMGQMVSLQTLGQAALDNRFPIYASLRALAVLRYGHGNCAEISYAGFANLIHKNVHPIEIACTTMGQHMLLILGRDPNSEISDRSTWGDSVIFCDIWANHIGPIEELTSLQSDTSYGQYAFSIEAPHCLHGELEILQSIMTSQDLNTFKAHMPLHESVIALFPNQLATEEIIKNNLQQLEAFYQQLFALYAPHAQMPGLQEELQLFKHHIDQITLKIHREEEHRALTSSTFSVFQRPEGCIGWCSPPPGSYANAQDKIIVPSSRF